MKNFLTLKTVFLSIMLALTLIFAYSVNRLYEAYINDILTQYAKIIRSDVVEIRLNIETFLNQSSTLQASNLPNILTRFVNIHPLIYRLQIFIDEKLVADSSVTNDPIPLRIQRECLAIQQISSKTLKEGHFCYRVPLHLYIGNKKRTGELYLYLNTEVLGKRLQEDIKKVIIPVMGVLFIFLIVTGILIWVAVIGGFLRLSRWSDDPLKNPPKFLTADFNRIVKKMHHYAVTSHKQIEQLETAARRESYLRSIMETVAKINELMIQIRQERNFLIKAVNTLTGHTNYASAKIFLKENNNITNVYESIEEAPNYQKLCLQEDIFKECESNPKGFVDITLNACYDCRSDSFSLSYPGSCDEKKHIVLIPLRFDIHREPIGYLAVVSSHKEGFYPEEIEMLRELAGDIGFAVNAMRQQEDLQKRLYIDPLTRLPNLSAFIKDEKSYRGRPVAIVNIDRFKQINDLYGVKIADNFLKLFADFLQANISREIKLFHYIADEFILLFTHNGDRERIEIALHKLEECVESHTFNYDEVDILFSVRFGATIYKDETSLRECQMALKEAKKLQKSMLWYSPSFEELIHKEAIHTYRDLKEALAQDRIISFYQGIYKFDIEEFSHYESLIRMQRPDGTIVSPAAFIDIAKQTRLYPKMTKRMVKNAIEAIEKCDRSVSVNLSIIDILNDDLIRDIYLLLEKKSLSHPLVFEILESENIENYEAAINFVKQIKEYGCKVAIDDFGSGYANFHYIAKLNADILKIDGSLIKELPQNPQSRLVVRNIAAFAKELGMMTIAEFVCDEAIDRIVRELGIDAAQGFFYHKPAPLEEIVKKG